MATKQQIKKRRADRVRDVFDEVAKATKKGKRISTRELSKKTGYSEGLVQSTIKLVNTTIKDFGKANTVMIKFVPGKPSAGEPSGWEVAASWAEWVGWHGTLHRHATTRVESLMAFADVMEGLWPKEAQQPGLLSRLYENARDTLDTATRVMTPRSKPVATPKRAKRGVRMVR